MIEYDIHENQPLNLASHWYAIFQSKSIQNEESEWRKAAQHAILFGVLASYDNHQQDLLNRLKSEKKLDEIPEYKDILVSFLTKEIISYPLQHQEMVNNHPIFNHSEHGKQWKIDLHTRVIEHVSLN